MIKRSGAMETEVRERMRGGSGPVEILHVWKSAELRGKTRLFARLRLPRGSSIGYHAHEQEEEVFYILSGTGVVNDDGTEQLVGPGDAVLTGGGAGHSLENRAEVPLELMAVILTW
jgi:mannose-6-phosphate isomerase-like protein (cupin superfamily)